MRFIKNRSIRSIASLRSTANAPFKPPPLFLPRDAGETFYEACQVRPNFF